MPRRSGSERRKGAGQATEEIGLGAAGGESETDAACGFDDAGGDVDQPQPQGRPTLPLRGLLGVAEPILTQEDEPWSGLLEAFVGIGVA